MSDASAVMSVSAAPKPNDFADWASPVLVKELRQGLKTRVFVSTFIVIQAAMVLLLGLRLLSHNQPGSDFSAPFFEGLLWTALGLMILLVMPLRGLTAISEEVKANTLDLVALTKMSTFRIVAGKWLALMAQTVLLTIAVLPYAVLRYFFGQVDIMGDLQMLFFMLLTSSVTTALSIALSTAAPAFRFIVLIGLVMSFVSLMGGMIFSRSMLSSFGGMPMIGYQVFTLYISVCYTVFLVLETTERIAPMAEAHSWSRRLMPMLVFPSAAVGHLAGGDEVAAAILFAFAPMMAWAVLSALTETTNTLPVVYLPWEKRGFLGRIAGMVLHPGWATGVIYTGLMTFGAMVTAMLIDYEEEHWVWFTLLYAALLLPVPILRLVSRTKNRLGLYALVQLLAMLWYMVAMISGENVGMASMLPTSAFLASLNESAQSIDMEIIIGMGLSIAACLFLIVAVAVGKELAVILGLHRHAAELIPPKPSHEPG